MWTQFANEAGLRRCFHWLLKLDSFPTVALCILSFLHKLFCSFPVSLSDDFSLSLFAPLAPTIPHIFLSRNILQCSSLIFEFCILYSWSINFALLQYKWSFVFVFFGILFLYIFIYHSGLSKYLHFTVQIFSGNVFLFFLHFKEPMVIT